jgi:tRNA pseudouridine38-40 synthase
MPKDIRCVEVMRPHPAFHARFHAVRKTYHYFLDPRLVLDPFVRRHALHCGWKPPDVEKLREAAGVFVGTHDFTSFSNKSRDKTVVRSPTRTIFRFDVVEQPDGLIRLEVEGNGFLYRMVRNMVGAMMLAATSEGKFTAENLRDMLEGKEQEALRRWELRRTVYSSTRWCTRRSCWSGSLTNILTLTRLAKRELCQTELEIH